MIALNRLQPANDDVPPEPILQWCRSLVATIKHGGVWGIPRSQIMFRIDQEQKKLILVVGETSDPDFIATQKVFKHIGWDVVGAV